MEKRDKRLKYRKRRYQSLLMAFLVLLSMFFSLPDLAYADYDDQTGSVSITYPVPGVEFKAYLVGAIDDKGGYELSASFAVYKANMNNGQESVETLASYTSRDSANFEVAATAITDEEGNAFFDKLPQGVYLITGQVSEYEGYVYTPSAILLELPSEEGNEAAWDIIVEGKYDKNRVTVSKRSLKVLKVWDGDEEKERPTNITVQLLCDGVLSDRSDAEVVLSKMNDWTYTYTELESNHSYTVVEKEVPDSYVVSISKDMSNVVVTNKKESPDTPSDNPSDNPPDNPSDNPSDNPGKPSGGGSQHLPKTGQLWWPVPMMIAGGLFCILLGLLLQKRKQI